ncbi:MAG: N-acetyltransferase [Myxococcales bacterium]|nr:N-acetyltransferase [Myxococcales bacterium]
MGPVEVTPISLPRDTDRFVQTWFPIYEGEPHWVPPLLFERRRFFDPGRNPYFRVARVQCFVASRGGRDVGTIAAVVDEVYQKEEPGTGFFGFFEFVDDLEVARALLDAARCWLAERGQTRMIGPFNFNTNHEFALLVDGFDTDPYVANPHNAAYYPGVYEALALRPVMDWYAYRVDAGMPGIQKMRRVGDRLLSRHPELSIRSLDLARFDDEVGILHDIYTDAWEQNWAHVRVTEDEFRFIAEGFRQIVDPDLCFVAEVGKRPAAISISLPDMNQVAKRMKGRLLPFGWWYLLRRRHYVDRLRIFMLGVAAEFQNLPLGAALYARTFDVALAKGYRGGEASLILENNVRMRGALEKMGATIEKTYRSYELDFAVGSQAATNEGVAG